MKMVKSLLLGTAAGLVAMTGAQAADLPVKAKPVQYVKICSLYGAGFYYIPGTDMCLKVGGWVRAEYSYGFGNGTMTWGPFNGNVNNRLTSNSVFRGRGYITADARNQSEYGTIRSYIAVGLNTNDVGLNGPQNTFSANRAFIQFAGFTFGYSQSFFDFYSTPATALYGGYPGSDTGDPGWMVFAYTAQLGGGLSATISAEERRMTQIINMNAAGTAAGGSVTPGAYSTAGAPAFSNATAGAYGGFQMPDIVANLRVNQAWGSAQVMGALHQVNSNYYTSAVPGSGHPDDKYGFAIGAGLKVFAPMIGAGDFLQAQVTYAVGASRYVFMNPNTNWGKVNGNTHSFGVLSDAVYGGTIAGATATDLQLTTAWGFNAAYEHFWNKRWKTSLYGGYAEVDYGSCANNMMVGGGAFCNVAAAAGWDNDWSTAWIGSRTQFNIDPSTYLALDVLYQKHYSGTTPGGLAFATWAAAPTQFVGDQQNWATRFRVHRDFYP